MVGAIADTRTMLEGNGWACWLAGREGQQTGSAKGATHDRIRLCDNERTHVQISCPKGNRRSCGMVGSDRRSEPTTLLNSADAIR
jgi:hypothetical protein